jgi:CD80-like C2-set immunoglobulin domain
VSCEAGGGARPAPTFTWLLNGEEVVDGVRGEEEEGLSRSHITLTLDRSHLGAVLICRFVQ